MKKLCIYTLFFFAVVVGTANAQTPCVAGSICVPQKVLDQAADTADKLSAAKDAIVQLQKGAALSDAERVAAQALIKGLNDYLAVKDRIIADYETISAMKDKIIAFQQVLIDRLEAKINKPRSAFDKVMSVLKEIALIAAGLVIGRAGF